MRILDDVNLDKIIFDMDGKTVLFHFIDIYKGQFLGCIECKNVILFNYHNVMDTEGFPIYIGQVDHYELSGNLGRAKLVELGFGFRDPNGLPSLGQNDVMHQLYLEGGEVCINLCCAEYIFKMI